MISYTINAANGEQIKEHLLSSKFTFPLEDLISDMDEYLKKITQYAERFEAWDDEELVGFLACYVNNQATKEAFITMVTVLPNFSGKGIASTLTEHAIKFCQKQGYATIKLEVVESNVPAIGLYHKFGFAEYETVNGIIRMKLGIRS